MKARPAKSKAPHPGWLRVALLGTPLRAWTTVMTAVGVTCAAVVGIGPAISKIEPYTFTTAGWVRDHVGDQTKTLEEKRLTPLEEKQLAQSLSVERLIKFQLEENLSRTMRDPAIKNSPIVQSRKIELEKQIKDTDARIEEASKPRRRPEGGSK